MKNRRIKIVVSINGSGKINDVVYYGNNDNFADDIRRHVIADGLERAAKLVRQRDENAELIPEQSEQFELTRSFHFDTDKQSNED